MKELDAFDQRIIGGHGVEAIITQQDVDLMMDHAKEFLATAQRILTYIILWYILVSIDW